MICTLKQAHAKRIAANSRTTHSDWLSEISPCSSAFLSRSPAVAMFWLMDNVLRARSAKRRFLDGFPPMPPGAIAHATAKPTKTTDAKGAAETTKQKQKQAAGRLAVRELDCKRANKLKLLFQSRRSKPPGEKPIPRWKRMTLAQPQAGC